jgi:hypothetical protein
LVEEFVDISEEKPVNGEPVCDDYNDNEGDEIIETFKEFYKVFAYSRYQPLYFGPHILVERGF